MKVKKYTKKNKYGGDGDDEGPSLGECFNAHIGKHLSNAYNYLKGNVEDSAKSSEESLNKIRNSVPDISDEVSQHLDQISKNISETTKNVGNFSQKIESIPQSKK